jgi:hypothetical protein
MLSVVCTDCQQSLTVQFSELWSPRDASTFLSKGGRPAVDSRRKESSTAPTVVTSNPEDAQSKRFVYTHFAFVHLSSAKTLYTYTGCTMI